MPDTSQIDQVTGLNASDWPRIFVAALNAMRDEGGNFLRTGTGGAADYETGQKTLNSSTALLIVNDKAGRRGVTIKNTDTSITIYIGKAGVTSSTGLPLKAGESIVVDSVKAIYAIAASGAPVLAYLDAF